jgi:hypothetical protein
VKRDRKLKHVLTEEENFRYLYSNASWNYTKEAILEIVSITKQKKFKFALVVNPEMSSAVLNFREKYPYWYINEKLASLQDYGITVIDPTRLLQEKDYKVLDLVIGPDDRYKNAKANFIIASYVFDILKNHNIISYDVK